MTGQLELDFDAPDMPVRRVRPRRRVVYAYSRRRGRLARVRDVRIRLAGLL